MLIYPFSSEAMNIIATGKFKCFYAAYLDFKDDPVRVHTSTGTYVIDGETYQGIGNFGSVGEVEETTSAASPLSVELKLSIFDNALFKDAAVDGCRGRFGKLMFCVVGEDGTLASDTLTSGRMDAANMRVGVGEDNSITVNLVDRLAEWQRGGNKRWTDENHKARNDGDRFFAAVAQMVTRPIFWGSKKDAPGFEYE